MAKTGARKNAPNGLRGVSSYSKSGLAAMASGAAGAKPAAKKKGGTTSSEGAAVSRKRRDRNTKGMKLGGAANFNVN